MQSIFDEIYNFIILRKLERLNLDPYFDKSRYQYCSVGNVTTVQPVLSKRPRETLKLIA